MELGQIVHDFATGMEAADKRRPPASSSSTAGRFYQPGIGPFREMEAVALTVDELRTSRGGVYARAGKRRYPASRNECDLALGELPDWAIEVKMARLRRDNGDYEDTTTKKILSPYPDDRSAVTDCRKLAGSGFGEQRAILIYGFEDPARPIMWLIGIRTHRGKNRHPRAARDGTSQGLGAPGVRSWPCVGLGSP